MSGWATSSTGTPSQADPAVAAAVERWVSAADDVAEALSAVVERVARACDLRVGLFVDGDVVRPDPAVLAVPVPEPLLVDTGPWLVGLLREALLSAPQRRRGGVHHTSPAMADILVAFVDELVPFTERTTVIDPAVGGGVFLLAACARLPGSRAERVARVSGLDIDPVAVAATDAALRLWSGGAGPAPGALRVGDALEAQAGPPTDVVIGNPPFLSQLRGSTVRDEDRRVALRDRWPELGGYADEAAGFLLAGVDSVVDGGVVALVQPASFLSARDAAPVRERIQATAPPIGIWVDGGRQFGAAVDTVAVVLRRGGREGAVARVRGVPAEPLRPHAGGLSPSSWAPLLLDDTTPALHLETGDGGSTLADVAGVTAGFRDQFYGLRGAVGEDPHGVHRLITAGLIDPLTCRWGDSTCRFDRTTWQHPVVDPDLVAPTIRSWLDRRLVPKLLVASQTRTIEVVIDDLGTMVPCTPVISIEPLPGAPSLAHLAAALTSPVAARLVLATAAGSALSPDAMRVSASALAALPLPTASPAWDRAAAMVAGLGSAPSSEEIVEIAQLVMSAYGVGDRAELLNWWRDRLPRR